jgi:hypothetical protein
MSDSEYTKTKLIQRSDMPWGTDKPDVSDDGPTKKMPQTDSTEVQRPGQYPEDSNKTVLVRPSGEAAPAASDPMSNPVAGWLVIIKGPGKGASVQVGYQVNSIGRLATNSISLNYNDTGISRENHAEIIYDSMNRKFYAGRTGGRNLTYVNGNPVLQSVELKSGDKIQLGSTVLRFVAFCGEDFNWEAPEEPAAAEEPKKE